MQPVRIFENQEQLNKYLRWWQEKLYLTDWAITARIVPASGMEMQNVAGENIMSLCRKEALIHILCAEDYDKNVIVQICHEQVLVHELLHCSYNWLVPPDTMEGKYFDEMEHQKLDQMAKSLILAKYNLPISYFYPKEG